MKTATWLLLCASLLSAQEAPAEFEPLPRSRFPELPGTCVLLLVGHPNPVTMLDGRSGAEDAYCVTSDRSSYRWTWVAEPGAGMTQFRVPGGKDATVLLKGFGAARVQTLQGLGVTGDAVLVEAEVNGGRGAAEGAESLALTRLKVLDGTPEYPIKVSEAVAALRKKHDDRFRSCAAEIDQLLEAGRRASVRDEKATGPRSTQSLTYLTWDTKEGRLEVRFQTRISDGRFFIGGGTATVDGRTSTSRSGYEWAVDLEMKATVDRSGKPSAPVWGSLVPSRRFLPPFPSAPGPR
ncbi:MAG: hypothetical protein JO332_04175 [Planctomycetaceae bacterium]|nr:hypothetical protein [Planctomycetaceae bacterium]